jgi:xanthine dehydrogenase YagT iron-sulfur-binding subunit
VAKPPAAKPPAGPNRRHLLGGATFLGTALAAPRVRAEPVNQSAMSGVLEMRLDVNGRQRVFNADVRTSLLDALRERLDLTGSKKGCDQGQCGACTVHIDGRRELACLTLAVAAQGRAITTIEGLADANGGLHPMQQAFIDNDGFQCGYCTPGQIMSAVACVQEGHATTDADIQEYMSGNLCRCAAYPKIVAAVKQARGQMSGGAA